MSTLEHRRSLSEAGGPADEDPFAGFASGACTLVGSPRHWFHLYFPARALEARLEILVTGSRPDQAVQLALTNPQSQITAIGADPESLRRLELHKERYPLHNLRAKELPLREAELLGSSFDVIFCSAEICYESDPAAVLRGLRRDLKPEGSMHLELLAPHGRRAIRLTQELLQRLNVQNSEQGLENLRHLLGALGPAGDGSSLPGTRQDNMSSFEALLRPEEKTFNVPAARALLEESGWKLQRFLYQAHYAPHCSSLAAVPELLEDILRLPEIEQAAVMELFRGTMPSHEFVVCRDDRAESSYGVSFEGDEWLRYVPVRNPGIVISEDDLPDGAAARLRWPSHAFGEIAVLINARQARLFNAVDDRRTIAEILAAIGPKSDPAQVKPFASNFFSSMWRFDYLWFARGGAGERKVGPA